MSEQKQEPRTTPSQGQKIADKFRKICNEMTESERERNFKSGMALIYGGIPPVHVGRRRR